MPANTWNMVSAYAVQTFCDIFGRQTCRFEMGIVLRKTVHRTLPVQGGVVRLPE